MKWSDVSVIRPFYIDEKPQPTIVYPLIKI